MANRKNTFLIKRSSTPGKVPTAGDLLLGELALNTSDVILYASGTTANSILPIGWDRVSRTGDTMTGSLFTPSISATTISATTYLNLPSITGLYLPLSGGTVTGGTIFTDGITANTISTVDYINFKTSPSVPNPTGGTLYYDSSENALSYKPLTNQNDVTINLGQESLIRIYNNSGTQINNGQVVHITGSTSGTPTVALANASKLGTTFADGLAQASGVATHNIPNGEYGFITNFGIVRDLDTSTFIVGQELFLSDTIDGGITNDPNSIAFTSRISSLGLCLTSDAVNGKIYVKIENENLVQSLTQQEVNVLLGNTISTGVYEFTGMTTASTTTFNIAPTRGWIVKNVYQYSTLPEVTNLYYTGGTNISVTNIASADSTYVLITSALTVTQQVTFPTPQQRRENIYLGKVNHPNRTSILNINNTVDYDVSPMSALRDLWSPIKYINQGIIPSPNGANLSFNTSAGTLWGNGINWHNNQLNPNSVSISGKTPASFFYRTQTGGTSSSVTVIDPTKYDIGGVITSITPSGSNDATNQRIYLYPTGVINVLYGQTRYATLSEAVAAIQSETFIPYPNAETTGILIGVISVRNDIVADGEPLTNTNYAKFTLVSKFGESFGGTGGLSTTTLQQAYDNSSNPEIVTSVAGDGVEIRGGTGNDSDANLLIENNAGSVTGRWNANGALTATTISATTYLNLPIDIFVTGGTYTTGTATFTNNTGGTFNVTGFTTGGTPFLLANTSTDAGSDKVSDISRSGNTYIGYTTAFTSTVRFGVVSSGGTTSLRAYDNGAVAEGSNTTASGIVSHAEGLSGVASGQGSHAEGFGGLASGIYSHVEGQSNQATAQASHAEGVNTRATANYSHSEGGATTASGVYSHSEGFSTTASGAHSHAEGLTTTAIGNGAHAEGQGSKATVQATHAEGLNTRASASASHAEGNLTTASGDYSHAEGYLTIASGDTAHAEGYLTTASGLYSHSEGQSTIASNIGAHAEGNFTRAQGISSHSEGSGTTAYGVASHAGGNTSIASGSTSFVHGSASTAGGIGTVVLGSGITGLTDNTTYVNAFNIKTIGGGTSLINLGLDSLGNVVTGSTGGGTFTGGTVTDPTNFTGGLSANTFSATTYYNLPTDINITGGTYSDNTFTYTNNTGGTFNVLFDTLTGLTVNGNVTITGNTVVGGILGGSTIISTQSIGDEGGDIKLSTAETNNTLSGNSVTVDMNQNRFRIFETGGSNRGVYIDLTAAGAAVSTNLLSGGGGEINTASNLGSGTGLFAQKVVADLQFKSLTSTGGTVTISNDSNTVNLEVIAASNFTGGTVNGATNFTNGLSANTISATTYYNLPIDVYTTGGTYSDGSLSFINNTGGTFNIITSTNYAAGVISGATYSLAGSGQINLPAIKVALYNNTNNIEPIIVYDVASGTTGVGGIPTLVDQDTNYIVVEYNGGSPRYYVYDNDGPVDDSSTVLFMIAYRATNFVNTLEFGNQGAGLANKLNDRFIMTDRFGYESGLSLSLSASTGIVMVTSGVAWNGPNRQSLTDVNSSGSTFFKNFHSGGTWTYTTTGDTINNTYYDNGTDIVSATASKYLTNWYFRGQEVNSHLYEVYGNTEYDNVALAQLAKEPTLPELITSHAILLGRVIIQVGASTGLTESAFSTVFQSTQVTSHNDLTSLQGGTSGEYYHLTSNQYNNLVLTNQTNTFTEPQIFNSGLTSTSISANTTNIVTVSATTVTADVFIGDGSQITNITVPYGIITAMSTGNYLI